MVQRGGRVAWQRTRLLSAGGDVCLRRETLKQERAGDVGMVAESMDRSSLLLSAQTATAGRQTCQRAKGHRRAPPLQRTKASGRSSQQTKDERQAERKRPG